MGASGRGGRLPDRSGKLLEVTFLEGSERPGAVMGVAAAFASLSRRSASRLIRTSDFRGSLTGAVVEGLEAAVVSAAAGVFLFESVTAFEGLASSTSPSSTSTVVEAFGVDALRELTKSLL